MVVVPVGGPEAGPAAPTRAVPRLRRGEFATAAWALGLLVAMFALKWFGVDNVPGRDKTVVSAVDAFNGLTLLRWLMLATIVLAVASVALHLTQREHGSQTDTSRALAWGATLVAAGLIYRVLIALPRANAIVDQKLGALVGLGCALGMAAYAWQTRRAFVAAAREPVIRRRRRSAAPAPPGSARPPEPSAPAGPGAGPAPTPGPTAP